MRIFEKSKSTGGTWVVDPVPPELQRLDGGVSIRGDGFVKGVMQC